MSGSLRHKVIEEDLARIAAANLLWDRFQDKTILISGANGFLPAYMVETLLYLNEVRPGAGISVLGLVRNEERARERFSAYRHRGDLKFIVQDVSEPVLPGLKVDYVIHAASQASPKYYGSDPVGTMSANLFGTHRLLRLAADKKCEGFLLFSSAEIYGEVPPASVPTKETDYGYLDPTDVRSCYAESKRAAETLCVAWFRQHGVPARIVRPFHTYGPGMRLNDGRVFADFVADVVNQRDIVMKSDGTARRAFCYLADATLAFFTVLLMGESGQAYNVGNDWAETSIVDLAERVAALFPERQIRVVSRDSAQGADYLKSPISRYCPDVSKIRALDWRPTTTIEEGFRRTIESFL